MADKKKPTVSQSRTMWVKKGDVVGGKTVEKGYLAQYGKPEKRVTANVKMVQDTGGVKAGKSQSYTSGRRTSSAAPVSRSGSVSSSTKAAPTKAATPPPSKPQSTSAAGKSAGNRQAAMASEKKSPVKPKPKKAAGYEERKAKSSVNRARPAASPVDAAVKAVREKLLGPKSGPKKGDTKWRGANKYKWTGKEWLRIF